MLWKDVNNIILPLFISTATPIEKQRDSIMSTAHGQILAYCKDMPMAKSKDYSYPCRQQIEADCLDLSNNRACDLLLKLKDAERDAREKQMTAREKNKDSTFWCVVPLPMDMYPEPVGVKQPTRFSKDSLNSPNLLNDGEIKKFSPAIQVQMMKLRGLRDIISDREIPTECRSNYDCKVEGVGRGCGRKFIYYSSSQGEPSVIQDILSFYKLDGEIKDQRGDILECAVMLPKHEAVCWDNKCTSGLKQIGY